MGITTMQAIAGAWHDVPDAASEPHDDTATPQQAFGARLKAARERRGASIRAITEPMKVSASLFAALERGDVSRWPKGVFRRAFFRDYVTAIGLPPDPLLREFLGLFPDADDVPAASTPAPAASTPTEAPDFRLTLAGPPSRVWTLSRREILVALGDVAPALLPAALVTWWMDTNVLAGAGVIALCYYPRIAGVLVARVRRWALGAWR